MRILIADDDKLIRMVLGRMLEKLDHEVVVAKDGLAAWKILSRPDAPRLAILDWSMPGLTGIQICEKVRAQVRPDYLYLMLLTAHDREEDLVRAFQAGADEFLNKPLRPPELEARLRAAHRMLDLQESLRDELAQRRLAETLLADLNRTLEQRVAERTAEVEQLLTQKNRFVNQLAHDLRTPLTPLVALLPQAARTVTDPKSRRVLELAIENANHMRALVEKTVDLARLNAAGHGPQRATFDLAPLVEECLELERPAYTAADLRPVNQVGAPSLAYADPDLMKLVIGNLLANARKYARGPGTVTVGASERDGMVALTVADEGMGMTPEQAECVFDEFYRADPSRHDLTSAGLGLSICRRILESHGGSIRVDTTEPGRGTVMRIELPPKAPDDGNGKPGEPR